ncbi:hypothetical protein I4U23_015721 [Adineta vaga]|nr:hypothetical protein I4U23_015721 [Adineta vaga]
MDCYTVHRRVENTSDSPVFRTWLRLSFEERRRVFDRLGNAHNPFFDYNWTMVDRDIAPQDLSGNPLPSGVPKIKSQLHKTLDAITSHFETLSFSD